MVFMATTTPVDDADAREDRGKWSVREPFLRRTPVSEWFYTQLGPGRFEPDVTIALTGEVHLTRARIEPLSVGVVVPDPDYLGFVLPIRWTGQYLYNGIEVSSSALYLCGGFDGYRTRGAERDGMAIGLPRARFVETVAALRGVNPDEIRLRDGALNLAPAFAALLRHRLATIVARHGAVPGSTASTPDAGRSADEVYELILDAYLHAEDVATNPRRARQPAEIVRKAEDRFLAADGEPIALADLCAAAGVGRTALNDAFQLLYGESPLGYFHKRRLMQAREALILASPDRGGVKRAALTAGLTELGRFSVEYRQLFGESPSTTLKTSWG